MDAGKLENTLKLLTAMTIANKNAVHTLILQRARRGEITKRELETLDMAMSTPLVHGQVPEIELTAEIRDQHDTFMATAMKLLSGEQQG